MSDTDAVTLRPATVEDADGIARVRVQSWRVTYRGIFPDAFLDEMDVEEAAADWERILMAPAGGTSVFVAEREGEVVAFAAGKMLDDEKFGINAELAAIYVRPSAKREGIGRRLLRMVADAHQGKGANGLLVWVLAKNEIARQFFEDLGAELLVEQPYVWDELELVEAGYGWRDLDALIDACGQ